MVDTNDIKMFWSCILYHLGLSYNWDLNGYKPHALRRERRCCFNL